MLEIDISALSSEGDGIGSDGGMKVFIPGALPSERVLIEYKEKKKNYGKAKLLKVLSPSKDRITPICPSFGICGGCTLLNLSYEAQLHAKRQKVKDALFRLGKLDCPVSPCLPSPKPLHYRNKIQLPISWKDGKPVIGLYKHNSHEIVPINTCFIQSLLGNEILKLVQKHLKNERVSSLLIRVAGEKALVVFVTQEKGESLLPLATLLMEEDPRIVGVLENLNSEARNTVLGNHFSLIAGQGFLIETISDLRFKLSAKAFFQVNPEQAAHLFEKAISLAQIQPHETVLDAYTGVGTLALFAAKFAKDVIGVEVVPEAIENAKQNAELNNIKNARFLVGRAEDHHFKAHTTFLNPPRKGCEASLIEKISSEKIIYVSCDPATLARDVSLLVKRGYEVQEVVPFDMFPQTMHVETIVKLKST